MCRIDSTISPCAAPNDVMIHRTSRTAPLSRFRSPSPAKLQQNLVDESMMLITNLQGHYSRGRVRTAAVPAKESPCLLAWPPSLASALLQILDAGAFLAFKSTKVNGDLGKLSQKGSYVTRSLEAVCTLYEASTGCESSILTGQPGSSACVFWFIRQRRRSPATAATAPDVVQSGL